MRRVAFIIGWCFAGALVALAALPWWLGWVAKGVASHYHAQFTRYERIGYARFALHNIVVNQSVVRVTADRAETETPLLWLFHRVTGKPAVIVVANWRVDVIPREHAVTAAASTDSGALHTRAILFRVARGLERWAPRVEIGAGSVSWPGSTLQFAGAKWERRSLKTTAFRYADQVADVDVTFTRNDELLVEAKSLGDIPLHASFKSVGKEITGELRAWDQLAPITATLAEHSWIPDAVDVHAKGWAIPASKLKLGELYATVRGDGEFTWKSGHFETSADVRADILAGKKTPPIVVKLQAGGDRESLVVHSLELEIPGANARLSDPVTLTRQIAGERHSSHFTIEIDLEKQPWLKGATGRASGKADVITTPQGWPHIDASVIARDLSVSDLSIAKFASAASLDWPRLEVKETVLSFQAGGQLALKGGWDFSTHELSDGTVDGVLHPSLLAHWLPKNVRFETLTLKAKAHGPLNQLQHEGHAQLNGLVLPGVNPLAADATWRGAGRTAEISEAEFQAGDSRVTMVAAIDGAAVEVSALKLLHGTEERLSLDHPARVRWSAGIEADSFALTGKDASLVANFQASATGRFDLRVKNFPSNWVSDFAALSGPEWRLASLEAQGEWTDGPLVFSSKAEIAMLLSPERAANLTLSAKGDREGILIETLQVLEGTTPIVNATGRLPLTLHPRTTPFAQLEAEAPLTLHATTTSNPEFWTKLAEATGLDFKDPEVSAELSGTWSHPKGEVSAKAARVAFDSQRLKFSFPLVEALDFHATADGKGVDLDRLKLQVEKQAVSANGSVAFNFKQWDEVKRTPVEFLRHAGSFHLEVPQAEVGALTKYLPAFLAPVGTVQINATIKPGGEMSGVFRLHDAATRPLGPLGVLQEIEAEAQLEGRTIEVKNLAARAGGQPVTLTGKIQLPLDAPPNYDLALKGNNLPLVRQTGLLLRADLDLKLATPADHVPLVTGTVNLHDSMFLSDVRALIPRGGGGGPARRPPFFAIETAPMNAWRLGVDVRGENFLRLRSTVFVGTASARFRLAGTLGEPRAIGEATVDGGQVLLPFAAFRVDQGTIRLTEADPYGLRLYLSGTSRRYGYDLRMEITGTAAEPIVTFSSNPPLEAKQVLMMVTAGETPKDEVTYSGSQRVARLGTYLGQSLVNNFGGDSADADRLSITSGERVSRQGRETYEIEYRLSNRFTLVGEYDEFDDYNAGVKWSFLRPRTEVRKSATGGSVPVEKKDTNDASKK